MNCVTHPESPAAAYCRTCGSALCTQCTRDVRGVIYCENCIASRLHNTLPAAGAGSAGATVVTPPQNGGPSPGLAAVLGFIPGVGAMYNGQFMKGVAHVVVFGLLIWAADHLNEVFGLGIAFWILYMAFDAYKTAQARRRGLPPPDPFGFERMFGSGADAQSPRAVGFAPGAETATAGGQPLQAPPPAQPAIEPYPRAPIGAIVLIAIGVLFLLDTMGLSIWGRMHRFWPVILIAVGVWMFARRRGPRP